MGWASFGHIQIMRRAFALWGLRSSRTDRPRGRTCTSPRAAAGNLGVVGVVNAARGLESALRQKNLAASERALEAMREAFAAAVPELTQAGQNVD